MKKSSWAILILVIFAIFAGWWWYEERPPAERSPRKLLPNEKLHVTVSSYAAYALTRAVAGDLVELDMLVPPGTEPHRFEPTPGSIIAVDQSDIFLYVSDSLEPWARDIVKGLSSVRSVEIAPIEAEEDPHVWITPYGALSVAKNISTVLSEADPAHQAQYRANFRQFSKEIEQLHQAFLTGLQTCKSRQIVHIGHLAFRPLAEQYGLQLQALTNTSHQAEHSVYRLAGLMRLIKRHAVKAIFTEEMVSAQLAQTLAQEAGVRVLMLYTIEEVSKADFEQHVPYLEYMRRNLQQLQEGLQCRE